MPPEAKLICIKVQSSWNLKNRVAANISRILGINVHTHWDKFTYLGLPITYGNSNARKWDDMLNKITRRIIRWGGQWLSKAGKLILVNYVLSTSPIYQFSTLLAPKGTSDQISKLMRDFLWSGGKNNENIFHLVNWETIKQTKASGGLQIRDPRLANLALGGKLLWQILHHKRHRVSQVFRKKYLNGTNLRCLDHKPMSKGTSTWTLCKVAWEFFAKDLYWVPGNGRKIDIFSDKIMDNDPLQNTQELQNIAAWLSQHGINTLKHFSTWDTHGNRQSWKNIAIPPHLETAKVRLIENLKGFAPLHLMDRDERGWGPSGSYTAILGYKAL